MKRKIRLGSRMQAKLSIRYQSFHFYPLFTSNAQMAIFYIGAVTFTHPTVRVRGQEACLFLNTICVIVSVALRTRKASCPNYPAHRRFRSKRFELFHHVLRKQYYNVVGMLQRVHLINFK